MVDYWPQEEGAVFDSGSYIVPCYPDGAIGEMNSVKVGTTVAGRISVVVVGADSGTGIGIALRASTGAGVPPRIPILFRGLVKATSTAIAGYYTLAGSYAMNNGPTLMMCHATLNYNALRVGGAASYIMGLVMQGPHGAESAASNEVLLLVGKTM